MGRDIGRIGQGGQIEPIEQIGLTGAGALHRPAARAPARATTGSRP